MGKLSMRRSLNILLLERGGSGYSKFAVSSFEMRWLSQTFASSLYPVGDPVDQLLARHPWMTIARVAPRSVTEQRGGCLGTTQARTFVHALAECLRNISHTNQFWAGHVDDKRWRCGVGQCGERHGV